MKHEVELDVELEIEELGEARQETKGFPAGVHGEMSTEMMYRQE